jgi:hypothetical protein
MVTKENGKESKESTGKGEASFGTMFQGIGYFALIAGIVLSMAEGFLNLPIKGATLGYMMIGGIIVAGIGAGMNRLNKSRKK